MQIKTELTTLERSNYLKKPIKGKPSSSIISSASSSESVQPLDRLELLLLEEATSFKAARISSASTACLWPSLHVSKLPRTGDREPYK